MLAVVTARNEAASLRVLLPALIEEGFEVALVDHSSRDETKEVAEAYLGNGVLEIRSMPWVGMFDLTEQLQRKADIYGRYNHPWLAHFDADEWPQAIDGVRFVDFLDHVDSSSYRIVNFDEFAFVPSKGVDALGTDFRKSITGYYFFSPGPLRLQRVWHRSIGIDQSELAGHRVTGSPELVWPENQTLRHYLGLSQTAILQKRANREYPEPELAKGWHANRLRLRTTGLGKPSRLKECQPWNQSRLDTSDPWAHHFWDPLTQA